MALIGMTIKQLPDFAFRSAGDYAAAIEDIHTRYDPVMGAAIVEVLERLSVFNIFRSVWVSGGLTLLVISIVVCTLDRTPKLWRGVADIRVDQPEPYFDPRLPDRAAMTGVAAADARTVLRRNHFRVREVDAADVTFLNQSQVAPQPRVPRIPQNVPITATGPDPALSLPSDLRASPGAKVVVPVTIDTAHPEGSTGM